MMAAVDFTSPSERSPDGVRIVGATLVIQTNATAHVTIVDGERAVRDAALRAPFAPGCSVDRVVEASLAGFC
ncbi:hypothetical protein ACFL5Z_12645 [Planctomycetota bacterium]